MAVFTYTATAIGGGPENGAFCYVYTRGTTTPATTYSDVGRTIPRTNPIVADADGRVPPAYFADATQLTFVVKTANGATTLLQVEYDGTGFFASYVQIDQLTLFSLDYTADGAQTKALTGRVISSPYQLLVAFDGDLQPTDNYTIVTDGTDSTLTWATNCQPASTVRVTIRAAVLQALSPAIGIDLSSSLVTPTGDSEDTLANWLALKAPLDSPAFTGSPTAPTASGGTNNTQIATTAFVNAAISSGVLTNATGLPISTGVAGLGTGVATALAVNVGSAGAPVVNGGALGTPSSGIVSATTVIATGSSAARSLAVRFAETVNVKDYGATGDGSTDDAAAITSALASNRRIYFPRGIYRITSPLLLTSLSQFSLEGDGDNVSIIRCDASASFSNSAVVFDTCTGFHVSRLKFDQNNNASFTSTRPLVIAVSSTNFRVEKNTFVEWTYIGLAIDSCTDVWVEDNQIELSSTRFGAMPDPHPLHHSINVSSSLSQSARIVVRNNRCRRAGTSFAGKGILIEGNQIYQAPYGAGIALTSAAEDITVIGNHCNDGVGLDTDGVYVAGMELLGTNVSAFGNHCLRNAGMGIAVLSLSATVAGNTCIGNGQDVAAPTRSRVGIHLASVDATINGSGSLIAGNTCTDDGSGKQLYGYYEYVSGSSISNVNVRGNRLTGNVTGSALIISRTTGVYEIGQTGELAVANTWTAAQALSAGGSVTGMFGDTNAQTARGFFREWADMSSDAAGYALYSQNLYHNFGVGYKTSLTHGSNGYSSIRMTAGVPEFAGFSGATTAGATVTPTWYTMYHAGNLPLGSNVATFLATPSSANLIAAITDETGSGSLVFATSPTIASPTINAAAISGTITGGATWSGAQLYTNSVSMRASSAIQWLPAANDHTFAKFCSGTLLYDQYDGVTISALSSAGARTYTASLTAHSGTAIPAGGTAGAGLMVSSATNFGVFFGSGAPTLSAAQGSLYLRSDGSGTGNRAYINTNGSTTWTALTTAA